MQILSGLGIGSGIDTDTLRDNLIAAERSRFDRVLAARRDRIDSRVSALAQISSGLAAFDDAFAALSRSGTLERRISSSDPGIVQLTRLPGATAPVASATLEVQALARPQIVFGPAERDAAAPVGQGTLTIEFGRPSLSGNQVTSFVADSRRPPLVVTIDSTNNSLTGLQQAINAAQMGLTASIVSDGSGSRLSLKGPSGADNGFVVSVSEAGASGLARYALGSAATSMRVAGEAADSRLVLDGVVYERPDNTITDILDGTKIELKRAASGTQVLSTSDFDKASLQSTVANFVDAYSELAKLIGQVSRAGSGTTAAGPLAGDSAIRDLKRQLGTLSSQRPSEGGGQLSLADIGVKTNRDGTITLDTTMFDRVLTSAPEKIAAVFSNAQTSNSSSVKIVSSAASVAAGRHTVTDIVPATAGFLQGTAVSGAFATPLVVTAPANMFRVSLDGAASLQVALPAGSYSTGAAFASALQSSINADSALAAFGKSARVTWEGDQLKIQSASPGSRSSVALLDMDATLATKLGLSNPASSNGTDAAGKIDGAVAIGRGNRLLGAPASQAAGLALEISGPASAAVINIQRGLASSITKIRQGLSGQGGAISATSARLEKERNAIKRESAGQELRLETTRQRLTRQFADMDRAVGSVKATQSYLQQQIDLWTGKNNN